MAETIKKKIYTPVTTRNAAGGFEVSAQQKDPEVKEEPSAEPKEQPTVEQKAQQDDPYAGYGGVYQRLQTQKNDTDLRRSEALGRWQSRLQEAEDARLTFAHQLKPEDTTREQRSLRRLAIGQSLGELLGSVFGGVVGMGKNGQGYVQKPQGLAGKTLERLDALRQKGVIADKEYKKFMFDVLSGNAQGSAQRAGMEYDIATKDDAALQKNIMEVQELIEKRRASQDKYEQTELDRVLKIKTAEFNAANNRAIASSRNATSLQAAQIRANANKEDDPRISKYASMYLPPNKVSTSFNGATKLGTTTTTPWGAPDKNEIALHASNASKMIKIADTYGVSDYDLKRIQQALVAQSGRFDWDDAEAAMKDGESPDGVISYINSGGVKK